MRYPRPTSARTFSIPSLPRPYHSTAAVGGPTPSGGGQGEAEFAPLAGAALEGDLAAVSPGDLQHQVEADAQPDQVAVVVGLDSREPAKEPALLLLVDPEAVVDHRQLQRFRVDRGQLDVDPARDLAPEAGGVVEPLPDRHPQPVLVAQDRGRLGLQQELDGQV